MDKAVNWKVDKVFADKYRKECLGSLDSFRAWGGTIHTIIENSNEEMARKTIETFPESIKYKLPVFATSDIIGKPDLFDYNGLKLSPTTVRYICMLNYLTEIYGDLSGKSITEIGAGYGGLCKVIYDLYKPESYTLYDLSEALVLQGKFLELFGITPQLVSNPEQSAASDIVISWCALSELTPDLQEQYIEYVVVNAENIFLCLNYDTEGDLRLLEKHGIVLKEFKSPLYIQIYYR